MSKKPFVKKTKNTSDSIDIHGSLNAANLIPLKENTEFSSCLCKGANTSKELLECKLCGVKYHADCFKIQPDNHIFFICLKCQHKLLETVLLQMENPVLKLQNNFDEVSESFDKLCECCEKIAPVMFEEHVNIQNSRVLHSSLCSMLSNASCKWNDCLTEIKRIKKIAEKDLFLGQLPLIPNEGTK